MTNSFDHLATAVMSAATSYNIRSVRKDPGSPICGGTSASTSSSSLSTMRDGDPDSQSQAVVTREEIGTGSMQLGLAARAIAAAEADTPSARRAQPIAPGNRVGRWTLDEKLVFLYALKKFGKGRWKKMSIFLPDRSLVQIKSHGQKVLKRLSEGENVFLRLQDNVARLTVLLHKLKIRFEPDVLTVNRNHFFSIPVKSKPRPKRHQPADDGREHIIAASALCQLAAPSGDVQSSGGEN